MFICVLFWSRAQEPSCDCVRVRGWGPRGRLAVREHSTKVRRWQCGDLCSDSKYQCGPPPACTGSHQATWIDCYRTGLQLHVRQPLGKGLCVCACARGCIMLFAGVRELPHRRRVHTWRNDKRRTNQNRHNCCPFAGVCVCIHMSVFFLFLFSTGRRCGNVCGYRGLRQPEMSSIGPHPQRPLNHSHAVLAKTSQLGITDVLLHLSGCIAWNGQLWSVLSFKIHHCGRVI